MAEKSQVSFIRKNGRIIPIRRKGSKGMESRSGDTKTKRKPKRTKIYDTVGFKVFTGGSILATFGQIGNVGSNLAKDKLLASVAKKRSVSGVKGALGRAMKARRFSRISAKAELIGLGISAVGAGAALIESLRRKQ